MCFRFDKGRKIVKIFFFFIFCSEADNAIVALDGKPPLNWEVVYANRRLSGKIPHGDQDLVSLAIASVVGRQNGVVQAVGATTKSFYSRQSPCSIEMESSLGIQMNI